MYLILQYRYAFLLVLFLYFLTLKLIYFPLLCCLDAPKRTTINKGNERQLFGGRLSVTLSCISVCYPAPHFVWYNKTGDKQVSHQNLTVYSNQAGEYYCTAENDFGKTRSDSVKLFDGE